MKQLTAQRARAIVALVRKGNRPVAAARAQGVLESEMNEWAARADRGEPEYVALFRSLDRARADAEVRAIEILTNPPQDLQGKVDRGAVDAMKWWLGRSVPEWSDAEVRAAVIAEVESKFTADIERGIDQLRQLVEPRVFAEVLRAMGREAPDNSGDPVAIGKLAASFYGLDGEPDDEPEERCQVGTVCTSETKEPCIS